jgi:hypothetical protein
MVSGSRYVARIRKLLCDLITIPIVVAYECDQDLKVGDFHQWCCNDNLNARLLRDCEFVVVSECYILHGCPSHGLVVVCNTCLVDPEWTKVERVTSAIVG